MALDFLKTIDKIMHDLSIMELKRVYANDNPCDLSYLDTLYLSIIEYYPNKYTSSHIADLLQVSRPAVTQKINELVKKDYIIRTQSESDKRIFYLSINENNKNYCDYNKEKDEKLLSLLEDKYSKEQLDKTCEVLEYFRECLENLD